MACRDQGKGQGLQGQGLRGLMRQGRVVRQAQTAGMRSLLSLGLPFDLVCGRQKLEPGMHRGNSAVAASFS